MLIIKPLAWLFRCVGTSPSHSPVDKYISLLMISGILSMSVYSVIDEVRESDSVSNTLLASPKSSIALGTIGFLAYNFLYSYSYPSILHDIKDAEDKILAICANPEPSKKTQFSFLYVLIFSFLVKAVASDLNKNFVAIIIEVFLSTTISVALIQHLVLVCQLNSLFSALNDQLRRFSAAADDTPVDVVSAQLQSVFRIHTSLHVTVSDVNGHFFIYNFLATASRLLFCLAIIYTFLVSSVAEDETLFNVSLFCNFTMHIICFVAQCVLCHACAKEANHTMMLAHHVLQPHTPIRLWKEVGDFSSLYLDNKVEFSVGGVFTLDRPLIARFSVLALSYLIVAVQLKDAHLFDDNNDMTPTSTTDHATNVTSYANFTEDNDYIL